MLSLVLFNSVGRVFVVRVSLLALVVLVVVSLVPVQATQPSAFADPAFASAYNRIGSAAQELLWGSGPLVSLVEPYTGAPGNRRLVQYFERGRMELNSDESSDDGVVSDGLLVREMATGRMQIGTDAFIQGDPAPISILEGESSRDIPAYAAFAGDASTRAVDQAGSTAFKLDRWMAADGTVSTAQPPEWIGSGAYIVETGHNIPDVVTTWFSQQPFAPLSPTEALGYPISEPYWFESGLGPDGVSLVQLYERRVLVYTPGMREGERFTLTNAGSHFYRWRYGKTPTPNAPSERRIDAPAGPLASLDSSRSTDLVLPDGYRADVLLRDATDVVDLSVAPDGRVALVHASGAVTLLDPNQPDAASPTTLVNGLLNPAAATYAGASLYVVDATGLHRYQDLNGDGSADISEDVVPASYDPSTVAIEPGPDGALYLFGQPLTTTSGTPDTGQTRGLLRVASDGTRDELAAVTPDGGTFLLDDTGSVWAINAAGQLVQHDPATGAAVARLDIVQSGLVDLLLYRPDGTNGDPFRDMLGLVSGPDGDGRILRLQPSRPAALDSASTSPAGTPTAATPGAVVDFITGFDRPVAMTSALDGTLYVLDAGRGVVYRIVWSDG